MRKLALAAGGVLAALLLGTLAYTQLRERRFIGVVLTPVSLAPGGTQQLRVYGLVGASDTVAVKARYRATGGVITPGGLYTAGPVAGTFEVIATLYDDDHEWFEFDSDDDVERADDDDEEEFRLADTVTVTVMEPSLPAAPSGRPRGWLAPPLPPARRSPTAAWRGRPTPWHLGCRRGGYRSASRGYMYEPPRIDSTKRLVYGWTTANGACDGQA
jgi:hypothetical protein